MRKLMAVAAMGLLGLGCAPKEKAAAPTKVAAKAALPTEARGLTARGNDPKVIALAKAALGCAAGKDALFDSECAELKAFRKAPELKGADVTLVNLLEDQDPKARYLGAVGLPDDPVFSHPRYREDAGLAGRMVGALATEPNAEVAVALARRVRGIDVEKTGQLEAIKAVVKERRHLWAVRGILEGVLFANSRERSVYDFMLATTHDADPVIRFEAVSAFWVGGGLDAAQTCTMWAEHLDDADATVASTVAQHLGWYTPSCSTHYDALLSSVETRLKAGTLDGKSGFATGLEHLCQSDEAKLPQKLKAARLGKALAGDREQHDFLRMGGLETVRSCDQKGGRAFVARYTHDKSDWVKEKAKDLMKPQRQ